MAGLSHRAGAILGAPFVARVLDWVSASFCPRMASEWDPPAAWWLAGGGAMLPDGA